MELRQKRKSKAMSQYELSKLTGISRWKISMAECQYIQLSEEEKSKINKVLDATNPTQERFI